MNEEDRERIAGIVRRFDGAAVGVVGDLTADVWMFGYSERVAREAPALVLEHAATEVTPGRAGYLARTLAELGAEPRLVAVAGDDDVGRLVTASLAEDGVATDLVEVVDGFPTPTRTRVMGGVPTRPPRLVVRLDREPSEGPPSGASSRILTSVREAAGEVGGWVFSDHGHGVAAPGTAAMLDGLRVAESRSRIDRFRDLTAVVANAWEAGAVAGHAVHDDGQVRSAGKDLLARTNAENVLLTRGNRGMTLLDDEGHEWSLPSAAPDVTGDLFGLGSTVVAAFTLALVVGAEPPDAAFVANLCAGLRVGRPPLGAGLRARLAAVLGT